MKALVYGILSNNLILLPEDVALAVAEDIERISNLTTHGGARRLETKVLMVPGLDDEDHDPVDTDPYDVTVTSEYQNGDWPPRAATIALDVLPDDLDDIGQQSEHFPDYPTLSIEPATEQTLVEELRQRGYVVRRDDELIRRIGASA
jgi:hypothetical protein